MASLGFFSFLLLLPTFFHASPSLAEEDRCFIEAIYSFGDSIADTGNLLRQGPGGAFATIASLPYGETTFGKPTGRCSDGLLMIDYLAASLNLSFISPYLDKDANFDHGVNFAVAGATTLDYTFFIQRGIMMPFSYSSLSVQLEWFKSHLNSTCSSNLECAKKLEHSLIMMGEIGGNDYNYAFFQGRPIEVVLNYVPHVVESIINAAKEVIDAGAVQLVIPGNFPIGCMPSYLTIFHNMDPTTYDARKCLKDLNSFAMFHNKQLQVALEDLRKTYPHALIMYADYYNAFMHLLDDSLNFGFEKDYLLKACCGMGGEYNFDIESMCGSPRTTTCLDPNKCISWDGIHLTQAAYKIMAKLLMTDGFTYPSYGVQERLKC